MHGSVAGGSEHWCGGCW